MSYMRDDEFYVWGGIDSITISKAARRTPEQQAAVDRKYMRFEKFMVKVPTYADDGVTVRYWTPDWPRWTRLLGIRRYYIIKSKIGMKRAVRRAKKQVKHTEKYGYDPHSVSMRYEEFEELIKSYCSRMDDDQFYTFFSDRPHETDEPEQDNTPKNAVWRACVHVEDPITPQAVYCNCPGFLGGKKNPCQDCGHAFDQHRKRRDA